MKKLLTIVCFLFCLNSFGQTRGSLFIVPDSTTNFGTFLPAFSLVYDAGASKLWSIDDFAQGTNSLSTMNKTLLAGGSGGSDGNGIYSGDGDLSNNTTVSGTGSNYNMTFNSLGQWSTTTTGNTSITSSGTLSFNSIGTNLLSMNSAIGGFNLSTAGAGSISSSSALNITSSGAGVNVTTSASTGMHVGSLGLTDPSAAFQITSVTKGFLTPRMTTGQRNAIVNPINGLMIFNINNNRMQYYRNGSWLNMN